METVQDQLAAVLAGVGPAAPLDVALHDAGASAVRVGVVGDDRDRLREALEDQRVPADRLPTTVLVG